MGQTLFYVIAHSSSVQTIITIFLCFCRFSRFMCELVWMTQSSVNNINRSACAVLSRTCKPTVHQTLWHCELLWPLQQQMGINSFWLEELCLLLSHFVERMDKMFTTLTLHDIGHASFHRFYEKCVAFCALCLFSLLPSQRLFHQSKKRT